MTCVIIYLLWVYYFTTFDEDIQFDVLHAYGWVIFYPTKLM
jgi:hypothetical protein